MIARNPFRRTRAVCQKTIQVNDFCLRGGRGDDPPPGCIQMLGRIAGPIPAAEGGLPPAVAEHLADPSIHVIAMPEDLPHPDSRVFGRDGGVVPDCRRTSLDARAELWARLAGAVRRVGWPVVLSRGLPGAGGEAGQS